MCNWNWNNDSSFSFHFYVNSRGDDHCLRLRSVRHSNHTHSHTRIHRSRHRWRHFYLLCTEIDARLNLRVKLKPILRPPQYSSIWLSVFEEVFFSFLYIFFSPKNRHTSVDSNCITYSASIVVGYSITIQNVYENKKETFRTRSRLRCVCAPAEWVYTYEYATDFQVRHFD